MERQSQNLVALASTRGTLQKFINEKGDRGSSRSPFGWMRSPIVLTAMREPRMTPNILYLAIGSGYTIIGFSYMLYWFNHL
jgi:hypothetical protein